MVAQPTVRFCLVLLINGDDKKAKVYWKDKSPKLHMSTATLRTMSAKNLVRSHRLFDTPLITPMHITFESSADRLIGKTSDHITLFF